MKWIGAFVVLMCSATVWAATPAPPASRLDALLAHTKTLTADFTETVENANAVTVKKSSGQVAIAKPGHFRWDYEKPYKQVIVADGQHLWLYDPGLEQVTKRSQPHALASGPAALLAGTASAEKSFTISAAGKKDGLKWLKLVPKNAESSFKALRIGLDSSGGIKALQLDSKLDQTTRIEFSHVLRNIKIDPSRFKFTPPNDADVVDQTSDTITSGAP
jgi:chaperone LolA